VTNQPEKRGRLIRHLEDALELADEIEDGHTGFLIEMASDGNDFPRRGSDHDRTS
jgi:hypothetical protein